MRFISKNNKDDVLYHDPQSGSWYHKVPGSWLYWGISPMQAFRWLKEHYYASILS